MHSCLLTIQRRVRFQKPVVKTLYDRCVFDISITLNKSLGKANFSPPFVAMTTILTYQNNKYPISIWFDTDQAHYTLYCLKRLLSNGKDGMHDWCWYRNSRTDTVRKWRDDHAVAIWPLHGELTFDWQIQPSRWYFVRSAWFCLKAALQLSSSLGNHMNVAANVDMSWRGWSASLQPWQPYESELFFFKIVIVRQLYDSCNYDVKYTLIYC